MRYSLFAQQQAQDSLNSNWSFSLSGYYYVLPGTRILQHLLAPLIIRNYTLKPGTIMKTGIQEVHLQAGDLKRAKKFNWKQYL